MPQDNSGRYFIDCTPYGERPISRMTRVSYKQSRTSTHLYPCPYPSISNIISRVDGSGNDWFHWPDYKLHLCDFVWLAQMQTARRLYDRTRRSLPNHNPVLDQLLKDGTCDRNGDTDAPISFEEMTMGHLSAMANHLLMRIESLEAEVRVHVPKPVLYTDDVVVLEQVSRTCTGRRSDEPSGRRRLPNSLIGP
jgi:hypothetical protein